MNNMFIMCNRKRESRGKGEIGMMIMRTMILVNEIIDYIVKIDRDNGILYVDMSHVEFVSNRMKDVKYKMQGSKIILKDYLGNYDEEIMGYIYDDVWGDCEYGYYE